MRLRSLLLAFVVGTQLTTPVKSARAAETSHQEWLASHMTRAYAAKPGMTAASLSKSFHHASALSSPVGPYVYILRDCPFIRVDVTFVGVSRGNWTNVVNDKWRVQSVSKPYLAPLPND
jgi:hypothetical protein